MYDWQFSFLYQMKDIYIRSMNVSVVMASYSSKNEILIKLKFYLNVDAIESPILVRQSNINGIPKTA